MHTPDGSRTHNHRASVDVRVHVTHRQRAAKKTKTSEAQNINQLILAHGAAGIWTSKTYASLLFTDNNTLVIPKDISNKKAAQRRKQLTSTSAVEALFSELKEHSFQYYYETEAATKRLRYPLWAHPETLGLAKDYLDILVLDCTYKTNKFNLPLLNIITITGMNSIIPVAQCWLPGEAEPDFTWALATLKTLLLENGIRLPRLLATDRDLTCMNATEFVYPLASKVLCRWHVNRNVEARVRSVLGEVKLTKPDLLERTKMNRCRTNAFLEQYNAAVNALIEVEFENCCTALHQMEKSLAVYLDNTWWKYKEKIVKSWTDKNMHFGCLDTSTVEGTHAKIKLWLEPSKGDLLTVFQKLLPWWKASANAVSLSAQRDECKVPYNLSDPAFACVVKIITVHALLKNHNQWMRAVRTVHDCIKDPEKWKQVKPRTGAFRRCHGRPCIHEMMRIYRSDYSIVLQQGDFDRHWWIRGTQTMENEQVLDPAIRVTRRKEVSKRVSHQAGAGPNSTTREPSHFEVLNSETTVAQNTANSGFSFYELLVSEDSSVLDAHLPPRSWGYAGLN